LKQLVNMSCKSIVSSVRMRGGVNVISLHVVVEVSLLCNDSAAAHPPYSIPSRTRMLESSSVSVPRVYVSQLIGIPSSMETWSPSTIAQPSKQAMFTADVRCV
jgi:hypothetical protein